MEKPHWCKRLQFRYSRRNGAYDTLYDRLCRGWSHGSTYYWVLSITIKQYKTYFKGHINWKAKSIWRESKDNIKKLQRQYRKCSKVILKMLKDNIFNPLERVAKYCFWRAVSIENTEFFHLMEPMGSWYRGSWRGLLTGAPNGASDGE